MHLVLTKTIIIINVFCVQQCVLIKQGECGAFSNNNNEQ